MKKGYLSKLNPEQYEAATSIDGFNFILAGAGSGKTATLVARVANMLDQGIAAYHILLLTFTNKAAKEMKERIIREIGDVALGVTACTFHSFCAMIVRQNADLCDLTRDFTIIDQSDMLDTIAIVKQSYLNEQKEKGIEYNIKDFPDKYTLANIYSSAKNNDVAVINVVEEQKEEIYAYRGEIIEILKRFDHYKRNHNMMDYDDLLYTLVRLLERNEPLRAQLDKHYQYISCDEYQDTNVIQDKLLDLLSHDYQNLMVVGDDNQSIYAFRHANINNILDFDKRHPHCKTIILDTNYRSSQELLDFSNVMMTHAREGHQKTLKGVFNGNAANIVRVNDIEQEADFIIKKIQESECDLKDIAVIARSASQTYILESKLNRLHVPYHKYGGQTYFEKSAVKDILSFLRISLNINDEIAMYRVLKNYPSIGNSYAQKIAEMIANKGFDVTKEYYKNKKFYPYIEELENVVNTLQIATLKEKLQYLTGIYYRDYMERKIDAMKVDYEKKVKAYKDLEADTDDIKSLVLMAETYRSTASFLSDLTLDAVRKDDDSDALNITTIHSAKGLEYNTVFVMDCIEQVTPRCIEDSKEDPEELRCMYVAVTRAKKELYLMVPNYYAPKRIFGMLSHFIDHYDVLDTLNQIVL